MARPSTSRRFRHATAPLDSRTGAATTAPRSSSCSRPRNQGEIMAHLKCTHERRVIVVRDIEKKAVIRHRSDGGKCDSRYVAIDKVVYEPTVHGSVITAGTSQDEMFGPLGPLVTVGTLAEAVERSSKPVRRIKKSTTKYRGR